MRKFLNNPRVVVPLACAAVGFVAWESLRGSSGGGRGIGGAIAATAEGFDAAEDAGAGGEATAENAAAAASLTGSEMFVAAGGRDPFAVRVVAPAAAETSVEPAAPSNTSTLKLAAVWLQGAEAFVAINRQIFKVGDDAADGVAIESVTREGAWLRLPSGRQFLPVGREVTFAAPAKIAVAAALAVTP